MPTFLGTCLDGTYQGCGWPGFPNRGQNGLRFWTGSPVLPTFDQSCQRAALALHSTLSPDRLDDTEGRIVDMDRST